MYNIYIFKLGILFGLSYQINIILGKKQWYSLLTILIHIIVLTAFLMPHDHDLSVGKYMAKRH